MVQKNQKAGSGPVFIITKRSGVLTVEKKNIYCRVNGKFGSRTPLIDTSIERNMEVQALIRLVLEIDEEKQKLTERQREKFTRIAGEMLQMAQDLESARVKELEYKQEIRDLKAQNYIDNNQGTINMNFERG